MDTISTLIIVAGCLQLKHTVVDFLLQPPWMWENKGTFGHIGGIAHSGLHAMFTMFILGTVAYLGGYKLILSPLSILAVGVAEFWCHYMIDYWKMNITRGLDPKKDEDFWIYLGADQFLHQLTYLFILIFLFVK